MTFRVWIHMRKSFFLFFCLPLPLLFLTNAKADLFPIVTKAEEETERDRRGEHGHSQKQSLSVTCLNASQNPYPSLVVRCDFFGRDQKTNDLRILKREEKEIKLAPRESLTLEFSVSTDYTDDYDKVERKQTGSGKNRRTQTKVIEVAGTGEKLAGYVIRVMDKDSNGSVVGEVCDSEMLRKMADNAPIKRPPAVKKKK
jgi:hypothetical protein